MNDAHIHVLGGVNPAPLDCLGFIGGGRGSYTQLWQVPFPPLRSILSVLSLWLSCWAVQCWWPYLQVHVCVIMLLQWYRYLLSPEGHIQKRVCKAILTIWRPCTVNMHVVLYHCPMTWELMTINLSTCVMCIGYIVSVHCFECCIHVHIHIPVHIMTCRRSGFPLGWGEEVCLSCPPWLYTFLMLSSPPILPLYSYKINACICGLKYIRVHVYCSMLSFDDREVGWSP